MSSTPVKQSWTPANTITVLRIIGVPLLVLIMLAPWETLFSNVQLATAAKPWVCTLLFLLLSFSDFLDGYLARSRNEVTTFGKFMDPLADKLLVMAVFLVMVQQSTLPAWVPLIVLLREFIVSGIRMMAASNGLVIAASWYGKAKTVTQMIALVLFLLKDALPRVLGNEWTYPVYYLAWFVLIVSLVLTLVSLYDYFAKYKHSLSESNTPELSKNNCQLNENHNTTSCYEITSKLTKNSEATLSIDNNELDLPLVSKDDLCVLAATTLNMARNKKLTLGSAESLTGGMISEALTSVPGSSDVFSGGIASYTYQVKQNVLSVSKQRLQKEGAENEWTAMQMAQGALNVLLCDIVVAVTGIAGPGGEEPNKPVGTVWTCVGFRQQTFTRKFNFSGNREQVRMKTTAASLLLLQQAIRKQ